MSPAKALLVPIALLSLSAAPALAKTAADGERIFTEKCTACHTIGRGKLVGPDLKGVTSRRDVAWLRRQIKEPQQLIAEGDPIAVQLVKEANGIAMIPLGLSDGEIDSVIAYLKGSGEQAQASSAIPSQYFPTLLIGVIAALGITGLSLRSGKKAVNVQ